jgi:hypothetical protein
LPLLRDIKKGGERMNWTKAKNIAKLGGALAISAGASVLVLECPYFNISLFLKCNVDFHYNAISMSATIGGFLFTGISILISTLEKSRIKRLWDYNYLDNLYRAAFIGISANVVTLVVALLVILLDIKEKIQRIFVSVEIASIITSLVFFIWSIRLMLFVISRLKDKE